MKTLEDWIHEYESKTGHKYLLSEGEQVFFSPEIGFFTYWIEHGLKTIHVPKMCGNGKLMRQILYDMMAVWKDFGFFYVYACSRVKPKVYIRLNKGAGYDLKHFKTVEEGEAPLYYYLWSWKEDNKNNEQVATTLSTQV